MNIKLSYMLARNKSDLKTFIEKNKLTSYDDLLKYCEMRKFIPCSKKEYDEVNKEVEPKNERKVSRKASKAQEPKKRRYRRKKQ
tara:strand:- start:564 stop:815 length:252 start_codon:yes stop_codon:yes gene_type:complete